MDDSHPEAASSTLDARARQAAEIAGRPRHYKICEGCDSIVARRVVVCPNCSGYRFTRAGRPSSAGRARSAAASRPG